MRCSYSSDCHGLSPELFRILETPHTIFFYFFLEGDVVGRGKKL